MSNKKKTRNVTVKEERSFLKKASFKKKDRKKKSLTKTLNAKKSFKQIFLGRVKRNPDGFGFFVYEDKTLEDVYIPKEEMFGVFSNDLVEITVNNSINKFGRRGKVLRVVKRACQKFIGRLYFNSIENNFFLKDSSYNWGQELLVENPIKAAEGELVLVKVTKYPNPCEKPNSNKKKDFKNTFTGEIISSIGSEFDPNTDNIRILYEHSVPIEFSKKALKNARHHGDSVKESDKINRKDLRSTPLITIDGVTAKDFDDAICVSKNSKGYKLLVAIADVSHYVLKGSSLDIEAYEKGASVYLANYVCPMLPEELSNGLCSLKPNVDRLCFCCEININLAGEVLDYTFFEGVMNSHARVTYGEAQEVLEGNQNKHSSTVYNIIKIAAELAEILNKKRMKEGSIDFNVPSIKVLINDMGAPTDLIKEERIFSHRLIEELMLITNICSAKFLDQKKTPQMYRIHEPPEKKDLSKLHIILGSFLNISINKINTNFDFQKLSEKIKEIKDSNISAIAQNFILRSMKQAQYSFNNCGHFGLNFTHYTHFTSPIRRYPDLVTHRQIKSLLNKKYTAYSKEDVTLMGATLSAAEQRAVKCERKVTSVKKCRFFESHVGKEFDGYINSLVKFGAFVTLKKFPLDGLIKLEELLNDYLIYDEDTWTLKGKRTGKIFRVGDKVRVKVLNVDISDGKIDFSLVKHFKSTVRKPLFDKLKTQTVGKKTLKRIFKNKKEDTRENNAKNRKSKKNKTTLSKATLMFSPSSSARSLSFGKKGKKKK